MSQNCTATLKVLTSPEGRVTVDACHTHHGHKEDLQHTWLPKDKWDEIAAKLQHGIGLEKILDDIRDNVTGDTLQ